MPLLKKYPLVLLPKPGYKKITCSLGNYYLVRHTDTNNIQELINAETGLLKVEAICTPREHIDDLSTSLLGVYNFEHLPIELSYQGKCDYAHYCNPDDVVATPIFETHFTLNDNRGCWTVLIRDIENAVADFTMGANRDKFKAECRVLHTPMKWNYWHFSVRWYLLEREVYLYELQDEKEKGKIKKKLGNEARALIAQYAKVEQPSYTELPTPDYIVQ